MHDDEHIPEDFAKRLRGSVSPRVDVPASVDRAVLTGARVHLARRRTRFFAWSAAAAVLVMGVSVMLYTNHTPPESFAAADINRDHQIDILDALTLARRGDDANRVEEVAMRAVRIEVGR
jgi:hypothetical protein